MSDTPQTDARQRDSKAENQRIPDNRWPWSAIDAGYDFARNLERQRNELLFALEQLYHAAKFERCAAVCVDVNGKPMSVSRLAVDAITKAKQPLP